jgi:NAD(P)-dependent dehydrogenase (short-subunit alcohol dehydrogenase family)
LIDVDLEGSRALVTGAGRGIGQATAVWLARAGCDVVVADKDVEGLSETVQLVEVEGSRAFPVTVDLRGTDAAAVLVGAAVEALGGLDIAVNNVGMMADREPAPFVDQDAAYMRDIVEQNLLVTASCCRAEAKRMVEQGTGGVIVNVSSGETTRPALGLATYGAAKAAINHLTTTLAAELGPAGIRVNTVAPGTTLTPTVRAALDDDYVERLITSIPLGRLNEPEDMAKLVVLLASDLASGVTGQFVLADNGAHLARNRPER